MVSATELQKLRSENELLQLQLTDLNYMIQVREEELALLRKKAEQAIELKSAMDNRLYELEQMQNHLNEAQRKAAGAADREADLEVEVLQSIRMEKEYYEIRDKFSSAKAEMEVIGNELTEASRLYAQVANLKRRLTELESNLEIAELDRNSFKEELDEIRTQYEMIVKKE